MRIAFFTPLPPIQSALADFAEGLVEALAALPEVAALALFVTDDYTPEASFNSDKISIQPHTAYPAQRPSFDVTVYSLGDNGRFHGYMLTYLHQYPGIVILNDTTLHRCIISATVGQNNPQAYLNELQYAYQGNALHIAQQISDGLGNELLLRYPLIERILDSSQGVIVQNQFAREQVLGIRPSTTTQVIPYPYFLPGELKNTDPATLKTQQRTAFGFAPDSFVIGSFGIFVPNKHLRACLQAFKELTQQRADAHYLLGGFAADGYDLAGEIQQMGLESQVHITGWQPPAAFVQQMFALDVGIHLRHPHIGGTPYTPIRLMGLGIATLTSDIEPLHELPQGTCLKIAPDDYAEALLTTLLHKLALDDSFRHLVGENGRTFIQTHHQLKAIARQYLEFFQHHA
ncbi:MAG: glycosyltransferase [Ardenticatenaceae bacterium]|nr:glycosyltransferase [Anaerolineales bacterium]MCB8938287.1 glycosyltransferase [Ardenticatenaceae bacterium]MCB8975652.1 glycosyltransferase [Ardenticatenaceae bacterium]